MRVKTFALANFWRKLNLENRTKNHKFKTNNSSLKIDIVNYPWYHPMYTRTLLRCEILDSGRGAEHRVGYHKLISYKRDWHNCFFIKYQTLDKNIWNFIFYQLEFSAILKEKLSVSIFGQTTGYRIYTVSRANLVTMQKFNNWVFGILLHSPCSTLQSRREVLWTKRFK